jgi:hypothetical protein
MLRDAHRTQYSVHHPINHATVVQLTQYTSTQTSYIKKILKSEHSTHRDS